MFKKIKKNFMALASIIVCSGMSVDSSLASPVTEDKEEGTIRIIDTKTLEVIKIPVKTFFECSEKTSDHDAFMKEYKELENKRITRISKIGIEDGDTSEEIDSKIRKRIAELKESEDLAKTAEEQLAFLDEIDLHYSLLFREPALTFDELQFARERLQKLIEVCPSIMTQQFNY